MQTQTLRLLILAAISGVTTLAAAQSPPTPPPAPPPSPPTFNASETIPNLDGYGDAYSLDEIRVGGKSLSEEQQVERWQAELAAGRARAGALLGSYLSYRALTPSDCDAARSALTRADELGNDQAAWLLGALAANKTCGVDTAALERWLKKAVTLDYPGAAIDLTRHFAEGDAPNLQQQYVYARVAADYWESNKFTQPRTGFDAPALAEMEKKLAAADRSRADTEATKILETMLKRHQRFGKLQPVEFARGDAGGKGSFVGYHLDYRHECQWNLKNNCRGAQRFAYVELSNKNSEFLACKVELNAPDFVTTQQIAEPLTRQVLIGPAVTRTLTLGDVRDLPDRKMLTVTCTPMPKLAANAAAGKCRAKLQGSVDVERFYPDSARNRGVQGSAVVRYWVPPGSDVPTDAEIASSSGDASLDNAALATVGSGKYTRECDYGLGSIRIAFKLQE
jgi:TonB family protein